MAWLPDDVGELDPSPPKNSVPVINLFVFHSLQHEVCTELLYVCCLCLRHPRMQNTSSRLFGGSTLYTHVINAGEMTKFEIARLKQQLHWSSWTWWVILRISKNKISKIGDQKDFKFKIKIVILIWNHDLKSHDFYRAMHFSAKRGIAIACRLSVRPSVCLSVCL